MFYAATFYGASSVRLPLNESNIRTHLHLDFLTGRPGPLFSAVGTVDFLYVEVTSSGRVLASVDLGAGRATVASPPGVSSVADRRWHSVSVRLDRADIQLILDDVFQSRATLPGDFVELNIDVGLGLGARFVDVPTLPSTESTTSSFRGCLRSVEFNSLALLDLARRATLDTESRSKSRSTRSRSTAVTWNRSEPLLLLFLYHHEVKIPGGGVKN